MFGNKLLVYIKKPSVYNLRRIRSVQERKKSLQTKLLSSSSMIVSPNNQEYSEACDLILKQRQAQMMKYQKSFLWSPKYTPKHFKYMFLIPAIGVLLLMLYIRYIAQPRILMNYKKKYGISLKQWQKRGWLDSWLDEYQRPDQVLTFEAYSLQDLQLLYKEGLLKGGSQLQKQVQEKQATKRKNKFVSGTKEFVMKQFKTT